MQVYSENLRIPVKVWAENLEEGAMQQASNAANVPFSFHHVAVMPDGHSGYGLPVGGVMATEDVVVPFAVGVDIGCGMHSVKTDINVNDLREDQIKAILGEVRTRVPMGMTHHKSACDSSNIDFLIYKDEYVCNAEFESARHQLGTLGGGNHFMELQKDIDGKLWIMIHCGSRNLGYKICNYYNRIAQDLNAKWLSKVEKETQLAFLPVDSEEGQNYITAMSNACAFAEINRKEIADQIISAIIIKLETQVTREWEYDIAHNYAIVEHHFGRNVWVHRKGATLARDNMGIIPGSQGTPSYIVKGKANHDSFHSCSHGAGRSMSRTKAKETLNLEEQMKIMSDAGVIHGMRNTADLEEAPGSYKDISKVMAAQQDLVDIVTELRPIANLKA